MSRLALSCSILILVAGACAARMAATTWGYSHWHQRLGGGSMGEFEEHQKRCLEQIGVGGDPASVEPDSPQEDAFLECMNAAHWCTNEFNCDKPGA